MIAEAVKAAGYKFGKDIFVALDPAASRTVATKPRKQEGLQVLQEQSRGNRQLREPWSTIWADWIDKYPIRSLEDGMAENDWDGWKKLTDKLGKKIQLVGDDLFVTNTEVPRQGHRHRHRQLDPGEGQPDRHAHRDLRRGATWRCATATPRCSRHRSGETEDATIADIAVATNCGQIKTGAPARSRPRGQVQPAAAHRRGARRARRLRRQVLEQRLTAKVARTSARSTARHCGALPTRGKRPIRCRRPSCYNREKEPENGRNSRNGCYM